MPSTVRHVSLASKPQYDALSHTWDDQTKKVSIILGDVTYPVTSNLPNALRYLRHPIHSLRLWVDAICINQLDIPERNSQVARMRSIYEEAHRTVVWLGDYGTLTKESVDSAFELALEMRDVMKTKDRNGFYQGCK